MVLIKSQGTLTMQRRFWFVMLTGLLFGCNRVADLSPQSDSLPEEAIQVVKTKYPEAATLVFKTLTDQKIWQVNFTNKADAYQSVVSKVSFLSNARMVNGDVPDSLLQVINQLSIKGGAFRNFRVVDPTPIDSNSQLMADYQWHGEDYTVKWVRQRRNMAYTVFMYSRSSVEYVVDDTSVLPDKLIKFYQSTAVYKKVGRVKVYVDGTGKKMYRDVGSDAPYSTVALFNESGDPLFSLYSDMAMANYTMNPDLAAYPVAMQQYIKNKIESVGIPDYFIQHFSQNGASCYYVMDSTDWIGYETPNFFSNRALFYDENQPVFVSSIVPVKEVNGFVFDASGTFMYRIFGAQVYQ